MFKKVFIILFISLMAIGVVAADSTNFEAPQGFGDLGKGVYVLQTFGNTNQFLTIVPFDYYKADYLINDSSDGYFIFPYENGTFNYVEESVNEQGSFEIVEFEGNKYIIDFSDETINDKNDFSGTYKWFAEFNKLNNVTPLNVTA